ncbi:MAG TPA: DUF2142 domain-containing protein [Acidiphilium sp.]|nr:MAG: hypothetical protein B7Z67_10935 [Acidiphilium sp. 21-60-14]OYV90658.1 MAG: hypothetical protein B7Z57_08590 [Acidiphilium sp. 37-60-79]HQT88157.1 DUF2142 domain-containing protein [Acidiphilium sp.]HQU24223.1 DUF2142 domain-containing protein [Acidiphilium sp.]
MVTAFRSVRSGVARGWSHGLTLLFVAITLYTGLQLAYRTPIGDVADEPAHIARSVALLHGQIFGVRHMTARGEDSGVLIDSGLARAARAETVARPAGAVSTSPKIGARRVAAARAISWSGQRIYVQASGAVEYFPAFYLPGALGVEAGALAGQRPLAALYTGRLFMLLSYVVIGAFALSLARFGQPLLFALLSLPMSVSLAASFNQDGQLIAAAALCGALLTWDRAAFPQARWIAAGIFAVLLCSKPPYGLLLFCALVPLAGRDGPRRLVRLGAFGLPALLWVLAMMRFTFTPVRRKPYHPGPLWPGDPHLLLHSTDPAGGVRVLLADPLRILTLPYFDIVHQFGQFRMQFIGVLGWLNLNLPNSWYHGWGDALIAAALATLVSGSLGAVRWRWQDAVFILVLIGATIIAVELSLYLDWTNVGGAQIIGVQGRYYLVIAPFVLLIVPRIGAWLNRWTGWRYCADTVRALCMLPVVAMALITAYQLPDMLMRSFYR